MQRQIKQGWAVLCGAAEELFPSHHAAALAQAQQNGWRIDAPGSYCRRCGTTAGPGAATAAGCSRCLRQPPAWNGLVRLGAYKPPLDGWIIAMKFGRAWSWAEWFGRELANALAADSSSTADRTVVCPVPMHWLRRWQRGYNQAELIAAAFARQRGWLHAPLLRRTTYTPPQTAVLHHQRPANVRGSFAVREVDLTGWHVWLIDDVRTTGSTLEQCANLLRQAGAVCIHAAVAATADSP